MAVKKRIRKKRCLIAILAVLIISFFIFQFGLDRLTSEKTEIAKDLSLDTECIEIFVLGNYAKIDIVQPGLDTCSLRVGIYDFNQKKVLSENEFSEAAWYGGLTNNGYYMIDQGSQNLALYSFKGEKIFQKQFSQQNDWLTEFIVSEDGKYFIYMSQDKQLHIYDIEENVEKTIEWNYYLSELTCEDNLIYLKGMNGEMEELNPASGNHRALDPLERKRQLNPIYGLETHENFIVFWQGEEIYIPMTNVDEYVITSSKNAFVTMVSKNREQCLRYYDLNNQTKKEMMVSGTVEDVVIINDHQLLVLEGSAMEKKHRLLFFELNEIEKEAIDMLSENEIQEIIYSPEIDIPEAKPPHGSYIIKDIPVISQFPNYPTGCETISAMMVLQYAGKTISTDDFIEEYLPQSADFYIENGTFYGPNPYEYFIGSPYSEASYGCMAPVMEKAIKAYLGDESNVINTTNMSLDDLCEKYIKQNQPVMIWATINMLETNPVNTWYFPDGIRFSWPGNEHCLVLVGYDEDNYYFNDPYAGKLVGYERKICQERYAELGHQSLVVLSES